MARTWEENARLLMMSKAVREGLLRTELGGSFEKTASALEYIDKNFPPTFLGAFYDINASEKHDPIKDDEHPVYVTKEEEKSFINDFISGFIADIF